MSNEVYSKDGMARSLVKMHLSMCDIGLPVSESHCFMIVTSPSLPCICPCTVLVLVFRQNPTSCSCLAMSAVNLRKKTPCTLPNTSKSTERSPVILVHDFLVFRI